MLFKKIFLKTDIVKINQLTFAPYTVWTTQTAHSLTYFLGGLDGKASVYNVGDPGSIPGLGRSPGEGNGNPLQYYCLENPMDRGAWWATVHGVAKSQTRLSDFTFLLTTLDSKPEPLYWLETKALDFLLLFASNKKNNRGRKIKWPMRS